MVTPEVWLVSVWPYFGVMRISVSEDAAKASPMIIHMQETATAAKMPAKN